MGIMDRIVYIKKKKNQKKAEVSIIVRTKFFGELGDTTYITLRSDYITTEERDAVIQHLRWFLEP